MSHCWIVHATMCARECATFARRATKTSHGRDDGASNVGPRKEKYVSNVFKSEARSAVPDFSNAEYGIRTASPRSCQARTRPRHSAPCVANAPVQLPISGACLHSYL